MGVVWEDRNRGGSGAFCTLRGDEHELSVKTRVVRGNLSRSRHEVAESNSYHPLGIISSGMNDRSAATGIIYPS